MRFLILQVLHCWANHEAGTLLRFSTHTLAQARQRNDKYIRNHTPTDNLSLPTTGSSICHPRKVPAVGTWGTLQHENLKATAETLNTSYAASAKLGGTLKPDLGLGELRLSLGGPVLCGSDLTCGDQEQNSRQNMNVDIVPPLLHGITLCMPA